MATGKRAYPPEIAEIRLAQQFNMTPSQLYVGEVGPEIVSLAIDANTIHLGGNFTGLDGYRPGQWSGTVDVNYEGMALRALSRFAGLFDCRYCGLDTGVGGSIVGYKCQHCNAPTARWWLRLDEMIHDWKRGKAYNA